MNDDIKHIICKITSTIVFSKTQVHRPFADPVFLQNIISCKKPHNILKRSIQVLALGLHTYPSPLSQISSQSNIPCKIFCITIMYLLSFICFCYALLLIILLSLDFSISCVQVNTPEGNVNSFLMGEGL